MTTTTVSLALDPAVTAETRQLPYVLAVTEALRQSLAADPDVFLAIRHALLAMKILQFVYTGGSQPGAVRQVVPYGILFGRMFSHKGLKGFGDLHPKILAYVEKHAPEYLEVPKA